MNRIKIFLTFTILIMLGIIFWKIPSSDLEKIKSWKQGTPTAKFLKLDAEPPQYATSLSTPLVDIDSGGNALVKQDGKVVARICVPDFTDIDYAHGYYYFPVSFSNLLGFTTWNIKEGKHGITVITSSKNSLSITRDIGSSMTLTSPYIPMEETNTEINRIVLKYSLNANVLNMERIYKKSHDPVILSLYKLNYYDKYKNLIGTDTYRGYFGPLNDGYTTLDYYFVPKPGLAYITLKVTAPPEYTGTFSLKDLGIYSYYAVKPTLNDYTYTMSKDGTNYLIKQYYAFTNRNITRAIMVNPTENQINVSQNTSYTKDVQSLWESEPLWINSPSIKYVGRDFKLHKNIGFGDTYVTDYTTPYFSYFTNLALACNSGYSSIETTRISNKYAVDMYKNNFEDDNYFIFGDGGATKYIYTQYYGKGYNANINYTIMLNYKGPAVIPSRTPFGTHGTFIITNHPDSNTVNSLAAIMYGSSDKNSPMYEHSGLFYYNLPATWGFFTAGTEGITGINNPQYRDIIEEMNRRGIEIVPHTISPIAEQNTRSLLEQYMPQLSKYGINDWIDHSLSAGVRSAALKSLGSIKESSDFSLDLFKKYNYKYCWSYIDLPLSGTLDMLQGKDGDTHPQIIFDNNNFGYDGYSLIQWNTYRPKNFVNEVNYNNLSELVSNDGISIIHDYFNHPMQIGKFYTADNYGNYTLTPGFDGVLRLLSEFRSSRNLWIPTVKQFIDYQQSIHNINIQYVSPKKIIITNNGNNTINGFTFVEMGLNNHVQYKEMDLKPGINSVLINE